MSIRRITAVLDSKTSTGNDRVCLIVLADKANDAGYCWPGLTHIQEQMNTTRQTALNTIRRLEAAGRIVSERVQRKGSKYLVLPGLTDKQIVAALVLHFDMTKDKAQETLEETQANSNKSTNHTSKREANLARLAGKNKSTNHTKKVYALDQNSLTARPDPSLTVIDPSSAEPAKPDSVPTPDEAPAPAKPKRKAKPKTLDNIKPIQAVVAYRGFGVQRQQVITGATMTRVNMVVKELRERWQNGNEVTADELKAAYLWHTSGRGEAKQLSASRDPVAVAAMVAEYREQHTAPAPPGDPDCTTCGGAGLVLGATDGKQKPCPVCKTEGVTT